MCYFCHDIQTMLKSITTFGFFFYFFSCTFGQDLTGQWKGSFVDKSASYGSFSGDKCDYVLDLEINDGKVTGTSYTYFTEAGKRYYTICNITGSVDLKKKLIEIQEINRTKTNIPSNVNNCFQVHKLTYSNQGNTETLEGNWVPAKNQNGNCGYGITSLTKRTLSNSALVIRSKKKIDDEKPIKNSNASIPDKRIASADTRPHRKKSSPNLPNVQNQGSASTSVASVSASDNNAVTSTQTEPTDTRLESRKNTVLKTIEVESPSVKVDLYDNGYVDGDSISLFYNSKLLFSGKRLTENAISLNLRIDDTGTYNELVMFAENLGSIAPNTALMVVTDGPNRYEVRIISDLEKSGVIRFVKRK